MPFINPLDVLGFSLQEPPPDAESLRKSRRAVQLEFDIAEDRSIEHEGRRIERADFLLACEELEDPRKLAAYRALQRVPALGRFLSSGDLSLFDDSLPSWVYHPSFVDVIGPHFAEQYARVLSDAVRRKNTVLVRKITALQPVAADDLHQPMYASSERVLLDIASEVDAIADGIENGDEWDGEDLLDEVSSVVAPDVLDALPSFFEGSRSKVAESLRLLSISAFNELDDVESACSITETAAALIVNALTRDRLRRDLEQLTDIRHQRQLKTTHAAALKAAAATFVRLKTLAAGVREGERESPAVLEEIRKLVRPPVLNSIPDEIAEVRSQIAAELRGLALSFWNDRHDADAALQVTRTALQLKSRSDLGKQLEKDVRTLSKLANELSAHAAEQCGILLQLLLKVQADTRGGLFAPNINWPAVVTLLDSLFDDDGIRLIKALKDASLKRNIHGALQTVLATLERHDRRAVVRIRNRISEAFPSSLRVAPTTASSPAPSSRPSTPPPTQKAKEPTRSQRPVAEASSPPSPPQPDADGSATPFFVGAGVLLLLFLVFLGVDTGPPSGGSLGQESTASKPVLGPTFSVEVVAASGKLNPIRVKRDDDLRRPYWVERGERVSFDVRDSLFVYDIPPAAQIRVEGTAYPNDYRDESGRVVVTRESATAILQKRSLPPLAGAVTSNAAGRTASPTPTATRPPESTLKTSPPVSSKWKGNQLLTGSSPYAAYFGQGEYSSVDENEIVFKNGHSTDAIVLLVGMYGGRVIRNEYIRAGETFTVSRVPNGTYFIRAFYGRDWNPDLPLDRGRIRGGFETSRSFSESRRDPLTMTDNGYSATAYEITLYAVRGGNMESSSINDSSFFN